MYRKEARLFAVGVQVIDGFLRGIAEGAHGNDHVFRIRCAVIREGMVFTARHFKDLLHVFFDNIRQGFVVLVLYFLLLEVDVTVFQGALQGRMIRCRTAVTEGFDSIHIHQFSQIVVIPGFDLLNFVRRTEAVEEIEERYTALDS